MGFDCDRFRDQVDEEFKCPICCDVIEDPMQVTECEHVFCKQCITEWVAKEASCPVDRRTINDTQLGDASRLFRNLHSKLELKCDFADNGCNAVVKIEELQHHVSECQFNPVSVKECENNCGAFLSASEASTHDCVKFLKDIIASKEREIENYMRNEREQEDLIRDLQSMLDQQIEANNELRNSRGRNQYQRSSPQEPSDEHKKLIQSLTQDNIIKSRSVENAMLSVDRSFFCPKNPFLDFPQSIGFGASISAPRIHAATLELLKEKLVDGAKVLDIGSGSGYLTVCMGLMVGPKGKVIGIDHVPQLVQASIERVQLNFPELMETQRVRFIIGDGKQGFLKGAPYNAINVGAAINKITSRFLVNQLKRGGRLVAPIIDPRNGEIKLEAIDTMLDGSTTRHTSMKVVIEELCSLDAQRVKS